MKYKSGSYVTVLQLKKVGIVAKCLSRRRYRVLVGAITLVCTEDELHSSETPPPPPTFHVSKINTSLTRTLERRIDLHGLTVRDAINTLENAISDGMLTGLSRLEIMHGLGSSKILVAVEEYLSKSRLVANFRRDLHNPGITIAYF
jgi:dsDNA-specific endonuclease/ATPase MutS2